MARFRSSHRPSAAALCIALAVGVPALAGPSLAAQSPPPTVVPDSTMRALAFMTGRWRVPAGDPILAQHPELADLAIIDARWAVGGKAIRYREHASSDDANGALLDGLIYWNPATERIEFVAVAGPGAGQGRLFVGAFTPLADGRVEKIYDVFYRTLADTPGEELGGARRRYREVLEPAGPDRLVHSLEWWLDGRWQRYARGHYELVRAEAGAGR